MSGPPSRQLNIEPEFDPVRAQNGSAVNQSSMGRFAGTGRSGLPDRRDPQHDLGERLLPNSKRPETRFTVRAVTRRGGGVTPRTQEITVTEVSHWFDQ